MPYKPSNRLPNILSSLQRPLSFASKDNFAHLETIKGLEHLVETVCNEADELIKRDCCGADPPFGWVPRPRNEEYEELFERISELRGLFKGFDSLSPEIKKERILRAEKMVGALKEIASSPLKAGARNDSKVASPRRAAAPPNDDPSPRPPDKYFQGQASPPRGEGDKGEGEDALPAGGGGGPRG